MYRIVYMTLTESNGDLSKFIEEIDPKDMSSKPIVFGLEFFAQYQIANFFKILEYLVRLSTFISK